MTLQDLFNLVKLYTYVVVWMTPHKLYTYVVILSVFNGCEVWNDLKNKELLHLNRFQYFAEKHTDKFSTITRSDNCKSIVKLRSETCEIEQRYLFFSWKTV